MSMELFGLSVPLPDFPRVKSVRGLGTSDPRQYADLLGEKFDYRNTFFHREPKFDIANTAEEEFGKYDFLISSEVLEHVAPPVETAFQNAFRLLKPNGVFVFTVPYSIESSTVERFPDLHQFGIAQVGDRAVLVNRTGSGELQVFENLVFHLAWGGAALEMREFSERGLKGTLAGSGFREVRLYSEDYPPFGIVRSETWSLPIAARKGEFAFSAEAAGEVVEQWRELKQKFDGEMKRLGKSYWFRVGRKLGWL